MKVLAEADIKEKFSVYKLDRFRKIRHDSNYRGYAINTSQAKELVNFWKRHATDLIYFVREKCR